MKYQFSKALATFGGAVSRLPFRLSRESFDLPEFAPSDMHGIPHVVRVMFWTHFLLQPGLGNRLVPRFSEDPELPGDALLAALLHDLGRTDHAEEPGHGARSVQRHHGLIMEYCGNDGQRARRIEDAVVWHCRPDAERPDFPNPVFLVLKDADALDRGRFEAPCDGVDYHGTGCGNPECFHEGCAYKTLRLDYENAETNSHGEPFRKELARAAWDLAQATRSAPWNLDDPLRFFSDWLGNGIDLAGGGACKFRI